MSLVIDASVALKWVLNEAGSDDADALLTEELIAPSLWLLEAANALWRRAQRGEITQDEARERLDEFFNTPLTSIPIEDDLAEAAALAALLDHPVHDCLYLALAIRENAQVVTADRRFHAAAERATVTRGRVRLLSG